MAQPFLSLGVRQDERGLQDKSMLCPSDLALLCVLLHPFAEAIVIVRVILCALEVDTSELSTRLCNFLLQLSCPHKEANITYHFITKDMEFILGNWHNPAGRAAKLHG
eukprot:1143271-Pelagomonas_calceolata.AAC.2